MAGYKINSESNFDKEMKTVKFFNTYFAKFKYIFLSNIYFLLFFIMSASYVYLTYVLCGGINIIAALGAVVFLNIGMAGITPISRYIYMDKEFSPFKTFVKGIKENWLKFLFHGLFFYFLSSVSYASISLYYNGTKTNSLFWVPLVITALISLLMLFASYYLNLMTVTMDISLKTVYKNSMLFSFGEIKNNFLATVALTILAAVVFTIAVIVNKSSLILLICGLLMSFVLPATVQYIITFYIYDDMVGILDESSKKDDGKHDNNTVKQKIEKEEAEEISRLSPDSKEEYIFHNGRMIKRSEVEKQMSDK